MLFYVIAALVGTGSLIGLGRYVYSQVHRDVYTNELRFVKVARVSELKPCEFSDVDYDVTIRWSTGERETLRGYRHWRYVATGMPAAPGMMSFLDAAVTRHEWKRAEEEVRDG